MNLDMRDVQIVGGRDIDTWFAEANSCQTAYPVVTALYSYSCLKK